MVGRKRALVTGGATGIGRAAVLHLARAGYDVGLNYRSSADAAREVAAEAGKAGAEVLLLPCDVADDAAVRAMLKEVDGKFGGLEVLINNAGTTASTPPKDLDAVTVEEWDRVFAVNVRGPVPGDARRRAAAQARREAVHRQHREHRRPAPRPAAARLRRQQGRRRSLTKTLAGALGPEIRVNAVAPGWMEGDWMQRMLGENYDRLMERRAKATPLERCVTADDVAETMMSLIAVQPLRHRRDRRHRRRLRQLDVIPLPLRVEGRVRVQKRIMLPGVPLPA